MSCLCFDIALFWFSYITQPELVIFYAQNTDNSNPHSSESALLIDDWMYFHQNNINCFTLQFKCAFQKEATDSIFAVATNRKFLKRILFSLYISAS